ncbi:MAG: ABC transporter substrate-binding protein [Lachnospiraceae bacterium]
MKKWKKVLAGLLVTVMGISMVACSSSNSTATDTTEAAEAAESTDAGSGEKKSQLIVARQVDSDNLDPVTNQYNQDIWVLDSITEGLVQFSSDGTEIIPRLADSWEESEDKLTWIFKLKEGIKFSDGTDVTVDDWIFSFERAMAAEESIFAGYCASIDTVEAGTDDTTLVIHLKNEDAAFLTNMSMCNMKVISKAAFDANGGEEEVANGVVGTGPYYIKEWVKDDYLLLAKNEYYRDSVETDEIMIQAVSDAQTRMMMLQSGEADVITDVPYTNIEELDNMDGITATGIQSGQEKYFIINHRLNAFGDVKVREAIRYAVDLNEICDMVLAGTGTVASSFYPPSVLYYDDSLKVTTRDVEKAKELLTEAGYPDGFEFEYCVVAGDTTQEQIAVIAQQQLAEVGITANIVTYENAAFRDAFTNNGIEFYVGQWTMQSNDPTSIGDYWFDYSQSDAYMSGYQNDRLTEINTLVKTASEEEREEYYKEMQDTFYDDVIAIPIYYGSFTVAYSDKVQNFTQSPFGTYDFTQTYVTE